MDERKGDFTLVNSEFPRAFDTSAHPILYHYCSTNTFLSIVSRKCLWFSDVNTMNDFGEMHWGYDRFIEAANLVAEAVGTAFLDRVDKVVHAAQLNILPMLCSLSTDGDVLSQWRAYAAEGRGVAIGFDSTLLTKLAVRIAPIEYSRDVLVKHFATWLRALYETSRDVPVADLEAFFFRTCASFGIDLCFFKNPAFQEEREVRLVRAVNVHNEGERWWLTDEGGQGDKLSGKKLPLQFRTAEHGGIISYIEVPVGGLGNRLIKDVVIGPRSRNNGIELSIALSAAGFRDFAVRRSDATYR